MKNKEELPMNLDRGSWQPPLPFARNEEWARLAKLFRTEPTDPASSDQPALDTSPEDALMELIKNRVTCLAANAVEAVKSQIFEPCKNCWDTRMLRPQ